MPATRLPRAAALWAAVLLPAVAAADAPPASVVLKNDVPEGQRPQVVLTAAQPIADIRLELTSAEGEALDLRHGALARGQKATLVIGGSRGGAEHYRGRLSILPAHGDWWRTELSFDTLVRGSLTIRYDVEHLDLDGRVLQVQLSRPAGQAELTVVGEDGGEIGRGHAVFHGEAPGTWLRVPWTQERAGRVLMLKLRATAADGPAASVELTPWSVDIEHEEVNFDTDSALIRPAELGKLADSYARIVEIASKAQRFIRIKLYVAGHTDTVGSREHNRQLSLERARAIATHLRKKGLSMPISYEGFGEDALRVATPDGTDEPRNRRVDYVLGAAEAPPPSSGAYRGVHAEWKALR